MPNDWFFRLFPGLLALPLFAQAEERFQFRDGHPVDDLPPYIQQVSGFGERPDWSADSKRIVFVEKPMGEVYELDLETGLTAPEDATLSPTTGSPARSTWPTATSCSPGLTVNFDQADREDRVTRRGTCAGSPMLRGGGRPQHRFPLGYARRRRPGRFP